MTEDLYILSTAIFCAVSFVGWSLFLLQRKTLLHALGANRQHAIRLLAAEKFLRAAQKRAERAERKIHDMSLEKDPADFWKQGE